MTCNKSPQLDFNQGRRSFEIIMCCYICVTVSELDNPMTAQGLTITIKSIKLQVSGDGNNCEADKSASVKCMYGFGEDEAHFQDYDNIKT